MWPIHPLSVSIRLFLTPGIRYMTKTFPPEGRVMLSDGDEFQIEQMAAQLDTGSEEGVPVVEE